MLWLSKDLIVLFLYPYFDSFMESAHKITPKHDTLPAVLNGVDFLRFISVHRSTLWHRRYFSVYGRDCWEFEPGEISCFTVCTLPYFEAVPKALFWSCSSPVLSLPHHSFYGWLQLPWAAWSHWNTHPPVLLRKFYCTDVSYCYVFLKLKDTRHLLGLLLPLVCDHCVHL